MGEPAWLSDDEQRAWKGLTLMNLQLSAVLSRELSGTGLSFQDYAVLAELSDRSDHQARLNDLGRQLGWEKSRLSHHVNRMEQRGLVTRARCPTDQRGWFVVMTPAGHRAIAAAAPGHVEGVRRHFIDVLTPRQISEVEAVARTVLDHLAGESTC